MKHRTPESRKLWNKLKNDLDFVQKYYRVTNLTLSPYMENGVYTEYEFLNDPNWDIWDGIEYKEITKEEYKVMGFHFKMKTESGFLKTYKKYVDNKDRYYEERDRER